jgi:hypothetical protein
VEAAAGERCRRGGKRPRDSSTLSWNTVSNTLLPGLALGGFFACFDHDARENTDFRFEWSTSTANNVHCSDTVRIACDRTLGVQRIGTPTPQKFALSKNLPNPCGDITTVRLSLPRQEQVTLEIIDASGRVRMRVLETHLDAGVHAVRFDISSLPAGGYFCRLRSPGMSTSRMITVVR